MTFNPFAGKKRSPVNLSNFNLVDDGEEIYVDLPNANKHSVRRSDTNAQMDQEMDDGDGQDG